MTTHRLPYRQERPKESRSGGVQVFGEFRARLEAFQQEVDRERLLDPALRQEVIDLLRGVRYGNQFIQEVYDELEAFIRSNQQGNRLLQFFRMYQDVRDLGRSRCAATRAVTDALSIARRLIVVLEEHSGALRTVHMC
jgi:hypothetical protein